MNIIFFAHPAFIHHQSMPRFARMLSDGMRVRGHKTEIWAPEPVFFKFSIASSFKKWLGYIDQYLIFPIQVKRRLRNCAPDTLFVFTDHALGPWVPLVADRFHIIHCHDFLAQLSAIGKIYDNPTSWTGKQYQCYIKRGYSKGKNFISVSRKTRDDLHKFLPSAEISSKVVYNGLNQQFKVFDPIEARSLFGNSIGLDLSKGYLLHVGGNQWYKNRKGLIEIYNEWRLLTAYDLPLLLIGELPDVPLIMAKASSAFKDDIYFLDKISDELLRLSYSGASVFLFPSLAEGFGWPIVEAMASGCPVITTAEAPMTEVAGNAGYVVPRRPRHEEKTKEWAIEVAKVINEILELSPADRTNVVKAGLANANRFDPELALDKIESFYLEVVNPKK